MFTRIENGEIVHDDLPPEAAMRVMDRARRMRTLGTPHTESVVPAARAELPAEFRPTIDYEPARRADEAAEEPENELPTIQGVLAWLLRWDRVLIAVVWSVSLWLLLDVWPIWLLAFVVYLVWACSKHGKRTVEDGLSAYSVFNPGATRIFGTVTAEELQAQSTGMLLPMGGRRDGESADDVSRRIAAQEEAQLQQVLAASLEDH